MAEVVWKYEFENKKKQYSISFKLELFHFFNV